MEIKEYVSISNAFRDADIQLKQQKASLAKKRYDLTQQHNKLQAAQNNKKEYENMLRDGAVTKEEYDEKVKEFDREIDEATRDIQRIEDALYEIKIQVEGFQGQIDVFLDKVKENPEVAQVATELKEKKHKEKLEQYKKAKKRAEDKKEIIEKIKNVKTDKKRNYKIILEGYKNIEIDLNKIQKMVLSENILKVKDFSKAKYDIKELANQNNLKGVFINRILQKEEERLCTKEEAEQKAKESKLKIEVSEEKYHLEVPEGQIIEQDPKYQDNYKIKEGTTIKVVISKGQEIVEMPKVVGKTRDEATKMLKEVGLEVKVEEEFSDDVEKNYITKQEVAEGEKIAAGTTVTIYSSMGIEQVQVPDLSGKTESEAKSAISSAKLKWKSTDKTSDSSKPNGVVVNQSISNGSMVDKNTEITITVNEFDEIKTGKVTVNVKSLGNYKKQVDEETGEEKTVYVPLKVTVNGEQVLSENVNTMTTDKSVSIQGIGTVTIKVYLDGNLKRTENINLNTQSSITIE